MIRTTHQAVERYESPRPAVFLDRDGTLTEYRGFITKPSQLQLVAGACNAVNSLRSAGFAIVLIINQSAIGRGLINDDQLHDIHTELVDQLRCGNAALDAIYFCPEAPLGLDETIVETPDRKPGHGMLLMAAKDLNLDLSRSWMIGDRISDVLAGKNAGCRGTILIHSTQHACSSPDNRCSYETCGSLSDAAALILTANPNTHPETEKQSKESQQSVPAPHGT